MSFCSNCGTELPAGASACPQCGTALPQVADAQAVRPVEEGVSRKGRLVAFLLGFFLGNFGAHHFYLGRIKRGIVHACLGGGGILLYIIGVACMFVSLVESGEEELVPSQMVVPFVLITVGVIALCVAAIWALVGWIVIVAGKAKDGDGLPVRKWTD